MLRLVTNLRVRGRPVSTEIQCMVLGAYLQDIKRGEIVCWVHDWLECSLGEAKKIVDSVIVTCLDREKV